MKICLNDPGHMTKMAFRPIYGKNLQKLPSSEQDADDIETGYTASGIQARPHLFK